MYKEVEQAQKAYSAEKKKSDLKLRAIRKDYTFEQFEGVLKKEQARYNVRNSLVELERTKLEAKYGNCQSYLAYYVAWFKYIYGSEEWNEGN